LVGTARFWSGHFFAPMGASLRPFIAPILLAACATFWSASAYAQANTTTSVTSSLNPSVFGQPVTFTATISPVAPGTGTPTGTVTFFDEVGPIAIAALSGGVATFTTAALAAGVHTITTSYGGDGNFTGSAGSLNGQVVNVANTTTTVTSSANPDVFGQSITFTATVFPVSPAAGSPTVP
jgi:large repetitive protein